MTKWTYFKMKDYINGIDGNGCKLLTTEEEFEKEKILQNECPSKVKLKIEDKKGHIFTKAFAQFINGQKQCSACGKKQSGIRKSLHYEDIKNYIESENGNGCKLDLNEKEFILNKDEQNVKPTQVKLRIIDNLGHTFYASFSNFKKGQKQCKKCGRQEVYKKYTFTDDDYQKLKKENGISIINIEPYVNYYTKIAHICPVCKREDWFVRPHAILEGKAKQCKKCGLLSTSDKRRKTNEEYREELYKIHNGDIINIETYININVNILHKCNVCGNEWSPRPSSLLYGVGCPICNTSKGEKKINQWLKNNQIKFKTQKSFKELRGVGGGLLYCDFYIPSLNLIIEYDGEYHFEVIKNSKDEPIEVAEKKFKKQQEHDRRKDKYAENNNILLLRIPYWEYENVEKILEKEIINL